MFVYLLSIWHKTSISINRTGLNYNSCVCLLTEPQSSSNCHMSLNSVAMWCLVGSEPMAVCLCTLSSLIQKKIVPMQEYFSHLNNTSTRETNNNRTWNQITKLQCSSPAVSWFQTEGQVKAASMHGIKKENLVYVIGCPPWPVVFTAFYIYLASNYFHYVTIRAKCPLVSFPWRHTIYYLLNKGLYLYVLL